MVLESQAGRRNKRRVSTLHSNSNESLIALRKGAPLMKYGRHGKPHVVLFRLSGDEKEILWESRNGKNKSVLFMSVTNIAHRNEPLGE